MADTYRQVGKEVGLTGRKLERYVKYMNARWEDSEDTKVYSGYAEEWAERFKRGDEWNRSDSEGQAVLKKIDAGVI